MQCKISFSAGAFFDPLLKGKDLLTLRALDQHLITPVERGPGSRIAALDAGNERIHRSFYSRIRFGSFFAASGTRQNKPESKKIFHHFLHLNNGDQKIYCAFHWYWHRGVPGDTVHPRKPTRSEAKSPHDRPRKRSPPFCCV